MTYKRSTLNRMSDACNKRHKYPTYIEDCAAEADAMVAEIKAVRTLDLPALAAQMRANSERWFPNMHGNNASVPLPFFYALGLGGECGELQNIVKKMERDGYSDELQMKAGEEAADVFTYLLLLCQSLGIDVLEEYANKVHILNERHARRT